MDGETLYKKAQNGGKGFVSWVFLSRQQKGLWNNAVREIQHEKDKLLAQVALNERESILCYLLSGDHTYICDHGLLADIVVGKHLL